MEWHHISQNIREEERKTGYFLLFRYSCLFKSQDFSPMWPNSHSSWPPQDMSRATAVLDSPLEKTLISGTEYFIILPDDTNNSTEPPANGHQKLNKIRWNQFKSETGVFDFDQKFGEQYLLAHQHVGLLLYYYLFVWFILCHPSKEFLTGELGTVLK